MVDAWAVAPLAPAKSPGAAVGVVHAAGLR